MYILGGLPPVIQLDISIAFGSSIILPSSSQRRIHLDNVPLFSPSSFATTVAGTAGGPTKILYALACKFVAIHVPPLVSIAIMYIAYCLNNNMVAVSYYGFSLPDNTILEHSKDSHQTFSPVEMKVCVSLFVLKVFMRL
jgi:hypothetical protein